jgi:hypothetical protein
VSSLKTTIASGDAACSRKASWKDLTARFSTAAANGVEIDRAYAKKLLEDKDGADTFLRDLLNPQTSQNSYLRSPIVFFMNDKNPVCLKVH